MGNGFPPGCRGRQNSSVSIRWFRSIFLLRWGLRGRMQGCLIPAAAQASVTELFAWTLRNKFNRYRMRGFLIRCATCNLILGWAKGSDCCYSSTTEGSVVHVR